MQHGAVSSSRHRASSVPPAHRASVWVQQSPEQEQEGRETPGKGSSGLLRAHLVPCRCSGAGTALLRGVPREPPWYPLPRAPQSRSGSSLEAKSLPASTAGCRIPSAASSFLSRHVCTQKQLQSGCWRQELQPRALPFGVTSRFGAESSRLGWGAGSCPVWHVAVKKIWPGSTLHSPTRKNKVS